MYKGRESSGSDTWNLNAPAHPVQVNTITKYSPFPAGLLSIPDLKKRIIELDYRPVVPPPNPVFFVVILNLRVRSPHLALFLWPLAGLKIRKEIS
jgi:hypothetical protein